MELAKSRTICKAAWFLSILILICYPLRHVRVGVDLWDGGYNYANFRYNSLEYMDSMWYFATWLSGAVGSLFMKLPFGNTMIGMNIYTGLIVSTMAIVSYFFCVKKLHMHAFPVFVGELVAITLCWAPTSVLYNYLTYLFLLVGTCLLYQGLMEERYGLLIAAGTILGLNVANRFSNLVQMGLIITVWLYGFWERKKFGKVLKETGFCVLGYVAALGCFLLFISYRYGFGNYVESVGRLFQMTEYATDYKPGAMLVGMVGAYCDNDNTYWAKRFLLLYGVALLICLLLPRNLERIKKLLSGIVMLGIMWWLWRAGFGSRDYATYNAIYAPCVILFEMALLLALIQIGDRKAKTGERLLAVLMILTILLTSLGGNNATYSSINNTFLVMPCFLWMGWRFLRDRRGILVFPVKCVLFATTFFVLVQCVGFGKTFVYEEATGGRNMDTKISEVPVLAGMRTQARKAEQLTGLYRYLSAGELLDRTCILYGQIPGVAYYMGLAPAINTWSDLRSYSLRTMEQDMEKIRQRIAEGEADPLVILEKRYADYAENGDGTELFDEAFTEQKMQLLCTFLEERGYEMTYYNEKFAVYEIR